MRHLLIHWIFFEGYREMFSKDIRGCKLYREKLEKFEENVRGCKIYR
jgi:hypothetical protein